MTNITDILGNTIKPGDTVVYPQMSGRSVQMVVAEYLDLVNGKAQLRRKEGARWTSGSASTKYRDKRTGKNINPHFAVHQASPSEHWFENKQTGDRLSSHDYYSQGGEYWRTRGEWEHVYVPPVYKDYVEKYEKPVSPVLISNIENIIKVTQDGCRCYPAED